MDLLNDPEFQQYRVKEIEAGAEFLRELGQSSSDYFLGAMAMLKRIMGLPSKMVPAGSSQIKQAEVLKARAFAQFEVQMMKRFVQDE